MSTSTTQYDIVTIGSATVDHFADTDSELIKIESRHHQEQLIAFPLGSKLLIHELKTTVGGGGTNTATAFAHLGLKTAYLGKLGDDAAGDFVLQRLHEEGIDFLGAREGQTGFSVILNSIEDDRTILAFKGANDHLRSAELPTLNTPWLYISSMLGESWESVLELTRTHHFNIAFNPSSYQAEQGHASLRELLQRVSILILNREEACMLLGRDPAERIETPELIKALHQLPPPIVVITDAAKGVHAYDGQRLLCGEAMPNLKIKETTGAGDAFAATFTAATIKGCNLAQALDYGMTNAESVLQHKGAKELLLDWETLGQTAQKQQRRIHTLLG